MALVQCKMCGGMVECSEDKTVGTCSYCGSCTTFPKIVSEKQELLYERAEHFRQAGEFERAAQAYESIIQENPADAEAYWGLVLSHYGIEYVQDPLSHVYIPTFHRFQQEPILADGDYRFALKNADDMQRDMYAKEANRIAEIQEEIIRSRFSEMQPYDVFICYKEETDGGSRTRDSVVAQDIYIALQKAGYKVFFARVSLEDKLGKPYEPCIFAALHSARVMLVIGTRKEYFLAPWVKNEWSRFLALVRRDCSKTLIPCYQGMTPSELPDELSGLQGQNMSRPGFVQELVCAIQKRFAQVSGTQHCGGGKEKSYCPGCGRQMNGNSGWDGSDDQQLQEFIAKTRKNILEKF